MISFRQADLVDRLNKKPMVWLTEDERSYKKIFDMNTNTYTNSEGDRFAIPATATVYERPNYVIVCDEVQFADHFKDATLHRGREVAGDIKGVDSNGNLLCGNRDDQETFTIDPLEYVILLSPDRNKVFIKYEPAKP